jgi:hypothetical protein
MQDSFITGGGMTSFGRLPDTDLKTMTRRRWVGPLGASRLILASGRGSYSGLRHRSPISSKDREQPRFMVFSRVFLRAQAKLNQSSYMLSCTA